MSFLTILIFIALAGTLGVLIAGLVSMGKSGEQAARRSNKLMRMRVIMQFITLILLAIFAAISAGS
jgi:Hypoxia induced protein conserved region